MLEIEESTGTIDVDGLTAETVAKTIDHSLVRPELTTKDIEAGCAIAIRYGVASVSVKPYLLPLVAQLLRGTGVKAGGVAGFPHGSNTTAAKAFEAREALDNGAEEIDMVMNYGALRSGEDDYVREDIAAVVREAHPRGAIVKVIIEIAYLTNEEKVRACRLAEEAGADFVKTSTGFAATGSTPEDLRLMRASVSNRVQIKAAHGVRSADALLEALQAGATRVGATHTAAMLDEWAAKKRRYTGKK